MLRIPRNFYNDCKQQGLPVPPLLKAVKQNYWIDETHESMAALVKEAEATIDPWRPDELEPNAVFGAVWFLRAVQRHRVGGVPKPRKRAPTIKDLVEA